MYSPPVRRSADLARTAAPPPAADSRPILEIEGLVQQFGERTVLVVPAWTVAPGRHSLVLGPSGSGKSTLLHLVAGLLQPSRGRIAVAGQNLSTLGPAGLDALRSRKIGIVLQRLHLISALSVQGNLRLARSLAGLPEDPERIAQLLDQLGLSELAGALPSQLSQGEAQRVAIARAVVNRPALILADEPTSALDDDTCAAVVELLQRQADGSKATLVVATHDQRLTGHFTEQLTLGARS